MKSLYLMKLKNITGNWIGILNKAINNLSEEPLSGLHIKKLWGGLKGKYRYAVGDLKDSL